MKRIALVGKMGSGKSTVAGILIAKGYVHHSWAEPVRAIFSMAYDTITPENYAEVKATEYEVSERGPRDQPTDVIRTGRELLQRIGTDALRNNVDLDFWVKVGMNKAYGLVMQDKMVVNDDTRFLNEADALRRLGFAIVRIERPGTVSGDHPSEVEQDSIQADYVLRNDGDLYDLHFAVDELLTPPWPVHGPTSAGWGSTPDCNPGCKDAHIKVTSEPWGTGDGTVYGMPRAEWDRGGRL